MRLALCGDRCFVATVSDPESAAGQVNSLLETAGREMG
jgi:hypothetical protein